MEGTAVVSKVNLRMCRPLKLQALPLQPFWPIDLSSLGVTGTLEATAARCRIS